MSIPHEELGRKSNFLHTFCECKGFILYLKKFLLGAETGMRVAISAFFVFVGDKLFPLFWGGITVQLLGRRKSGCPEFIRSIVAKHYEELEHINIMVHLGLICKRQCSKLTGDFIRNPDNWNIRIISLKKKTSRQPLPERSHCSTHWCPVSDFALSTPLCQDFDAGLQADRTKEAPHHSPRTIHYVCPINTS